MSLILGDPTFASEAATPSLKFFRAVRFLKDNAPHAVRIREMGVLAQNSMDRWLWDMLERKIDDAAL